MPEFKACFEQLERIGCRNWVVTNRIIFFVSSVVNIF